MVRGMLLVCPNRASYERSDAEQTERAGQDAAESGSRSHILTTDILLIDLLRQHAV